MAARRLESEKKQRRQMDRYLDKRRTLPTAEIMRTTANKLRGHYAYYGVSGNSRSISNFACQVELILFKWPGRRGKRGSLNFEKFRLLRQRFPLPPPANSGEPMVTSSAKRVVEEPCA